MILLFTDFGSYDIYLGQVKLALMQHSPDAQIIDLLHHAPDFNALANAHLLAALATQAGQRGSVTMAVVDAGVGGHRQAVVVKADQRWYVGPDNGLLTVIAARAESYQAWRIVWEPQQLSLSFHGRDLFAPVAALLDAQMLPQDWLLPLPALEMNFGAADLLQIIYVDHYGNAMTGLRAEQISSTDRLAVNGNILLHARVFCDAPPGTAFWYVNSIGLVEIAVNCGNAAQQLGLAIGNNVVLVSVQKS